jgi:hypothetical protein
MESNSDPVWIMFITDTETRDKLLSYSSGSQWQVDPNTAIGLLIPRQQRPDDDQPSALPAG